MKGINIIKESIAFMLSFFINSKFLFGLFLFAPCAISVSFAEGNLSDLSGKGTSDSPYQISSLENLYWFVEKVDSVISNASDKVMFEKASQELYADLTVDITINPSVLDANGNLNPNHSTFEKWKPIGMPQSATGNFFYYLSTFDGNGHTISGLYCEDWAASFMFALGSRGCIKNLIIKDSYFKGKPYAASFVTFASGTLENCASFSTVIAEEGEPYYTNESKKVINYSKPSTEPLALAGGLVASLVPYKYVSNDKYKDYDIILAGSASYGKVVSISNSGSAAYASGLVGAFTTFHKYWNEYFVNLEYTKLHFKSSFSSVELSSTTDSVAPFFSFMILGAPGKESGSVLLPKYEIYSTSYYDSYKCEYQHRESPYYSNVNNTYCVAVNGNKKVLLGIPVSSNRKDSLNPLPTSSFLSGELCYKLNNNSSDSPKWFQHIGVDSMPSPFSTDFIVYKQDENTTYCNGDPMPQYTNQILPDKSHLLTTINATAPTCTTDGNIEYIECLKCNSFFSPSDPTQHNDNTSFIIPASGHDYIYTSVWSADSTQCEISWTCNNNDSHTGSETVASQKSQITIPSCTQSGRSAYVAILENSDHKFSDTLFYEIKPNGHTYTYVKPLEPTCETLGHKEHYQCAVCSKYFTKSDNRYTEVLYDDLLLPAKGHNYQIKWNWASNDNCELSLICANDATHSHQVTPSIKSEVLVEPTCKTEGVIAYIASIEYESKFASDTLKEVLPMVSHKREVVAEVPSTCEDFGVRSHFKCSMCDSIFANETGNALKDNASLQISPTGHSYKFASLSFDTVSYSYVVYYACANDPNHTVTDESHLTISKTDSIPSTCIKHGKLTLSLKSNLYDTVDSTLSYSLPLAKHRHAYKEGKAPSCEDEGLESHYQCTVCDSVFDKSFKPSDAENFILSPLGHAYKFATFDFDTLSYDYSINCVCEHNSDHTVSLHTGAEIISETHTPSTCVSHGSKTLQIELTVGEVVIPKTVSFQLPLAKHKYEYIAEQLPSCGVYGVAEHFVCEKCDSIFDADKVPTVISDLQIDKIEHKFENPKSNWSGDFSSAKITIPCSNSCGEVLSDSVCADSLVISAPNCKNNGKIKYFVTTDLGGEEYNADTIIALPSLPTAHIDKDGDKICDICNVRLVSIINDIPCVTEYFRVMGSDIILLSESAKYEICDIHGRTVYSGGAGRVSLKSGVYVLSVQGVSYKLLLK